MIWVDSHSDPKTSILVNISPPKERKFYVQRGKILKKKNIEFHATVKTLGIIRPRHI